MDLHAGGRGEGYKLAFRELECLWDKWIKNFVGKLIVELNNLDHKCCVKPFNDSLDNFILSIMF
jgi:hypothetical protein